MTIPLINNNFEFEECPECSKKPGTPTLCRSCIHNRDTIQTLQDLLVRWTKTIPTESGYYWLKYKNTFSEEESEPIILLLYKYRGHLYIYWDAGPDETIKQFIKRNSHYTDIMWSSKIECYDMK